jgi:hypothetical protein
MEEPLLDIDTVCNNLNLDITKLISTHLNPLITDMKLASSSLNAIKNILYSLPEYKELERELADLKVEHESLKKHLNNKAIRMEITEKYTDKTNNNNNTIDYNISTANKVINLTSNTSISQEMSILSNSSEDEDDDEDNLETESDENTIKDDINLNETTKTVTIDVADHREDDNITLSNNNVIEQENIESDEDSQEDSEESEEENIDEEVKEEGTDKLLENKKENNVEEEQEQEEEHKEEQGEEEEEEVFEIDIEGKTYFTTGKTNGIVYEYLEDEDDIGDKIGEYKNGVLIWKNK